MRSKILYLITGIFLLTIFTQCEDSLTITANQEEEEEELPIPELVSPTNNSTNQSIQVELSWKRIKGAKDYKIQLSKSENLDSTLVDSMIEGTSYTTPELEAETTYFWRVKPFKKNNEGPWSETWEFTTSAGEVEPVTVELQSPENGAVLETIPAFEWSSVSESSGYHYQLSRDTDFNDLVKDSVVEVTNLEVALSDSSGTYHWRVSPLVDSAPTEWSEVYDFTKEEASNDSTVLTAPQQVSPSNEATGVSLQPTFEWEPVEGADYYILHANRIDPAEMVVETEVQGTTFTPESDLDTETTHDWRVRAVSGDTKGEWSDINQFTTGSGGDDSDSNTTVTLTSPSDGAGSQLTNLTLDWESVSGVNEYQVQLAPSSSFSSPVVDEAVTESSYSVSGLDYSQTYYWRAQVNGDGDSGNWSAVYTFTTESESSGGDDNGDYANSVEGDRQALMDLYNATGGSSWYNDSGWGSGNPSGNWYGIDVDSQGRVTRIDLSDNNLSGSLPESIGNLSKVKYFNVKQNNMTGQIPTSIGQMASLTHLLLNGRIHDLDTEKSYHPGKPHGGSWADERSNNFTGQVPSSIGNLQNLQWFEMSGSDAPGEEGLSGSIPSELNNLSNLRGISLAFNSLSNLPNLGNLSNLERLILQGNPMEGHGLPSWVGQLTNLKNIWIPDMQLGGTIPDLSALTKLRIFQAPQNDFSGELPSFFIDGTMPEINMLALAWNNLSGSVPAFGQTNLAMFTVDGNNLSGQIPTSISSQTSMINLGLGWNDFEGELPSDLTDMSRLRYIRANDNNFTGTVPLVDVSNEKLQFIHMQGNSLSEEISTKLAEVGNLPKFKTLDVSSNPLDDSDLQPIIDELESDGNLNILNY